MTRRPDLDALLQDVYDRALAMRSVTLLADEDMRDRVDHVSRNLSNRACVRLLMACLLGKLENSSVDPRKPYTEIASEDCFSGRILDERYLSAFIHRHDLPCNPTTAFLTPTLRNINRPLFVDVELVGRPRELYVKTLQLLEDVATGHVDADTLFVEVVRVLLLIRDEKKARIGSLMEALRRSKDALPLSSEQIVTLIRQHLACRGASRLPVLVIAAAYHAVGEFIGEFLLPLLSHNAADLQTKSIGDLEIRLRADDAVVMAYEMKMRKVSKEDVDIAVAKIICSNGIVQNYIFITKDIIDPAVTNYASRLYEEMGGVEIVVLDCIGFLRHFLHFFHRSRAVYLDAYQDFVLAEPDSAVGSALKEAFLALRQAAESGD
ncbi:MAG: restriction endonuclease, SacI family [Magnetococcales bacterium]|nr:restriction endonuclease, SacI family [Magnetococcales bacterium]